MSNQRNTKTPNTKPQSRDRTTTPIKDVVCFKCHGHGNFKNECPNARAFTQREWTEINSRVGPRAMLIFMGGKEEVILPPTLVDGPEGTYVLTT